MSHSHIADVTTHEDTTELLELEDGAVAVAVAVVENVEAVDPVARAAAEARALALGRADRVLGVLPG